MDFVLSCAATATAKIWTTQIQLGLHIYVKGVGYCGEPPAALHQGIGHAFWRETPVNINNSSFRLRCCLGRNFGWCSYALWNRRLWADKEKRTLLQAMRLCTGRTAHRGSRGIALLFHDYGTRRGWGVSVTPRPLFTPGKDPVPIV